MRIMVWSSDVCSSDLVRGDAGANEGLLQRYLSRLDDAPVFNINDAERYLLLARDIPGIDARLPLRPGTNAGEVVGEVEVTRNPMKIGRESGRERRGKYVEK